jgi:hypothetical protein
VSFELELHADVDDWQQAERAAAATASTGHVAVVVGRRKRWGRPLKPGIRFDWHQAQDVLSEDADWSQDAFTLSADGRRQLAATVLALSGVLSPGWGIRAYWIGDPVTNEQTLTAQELAELVMQSRLDRGTLYRVS